jgi:hypothetical protein
MILEIFGTIAPVPATLSHHKAPARQYTSMYRQIEWPHGAILLEPKPLLVAMRPGAIRSSTDVGGRTRVALCGNRIAVVVHLREFAAIEEEDNPVSDPLSMPVVRIDDIQCR